MPAHARETIKQGARQSTAAVAANFPFPSSTERVQRSGYCRLDDTRAPFRVVPGSTVCGGG